MMQFGGKDSKRHFTVVMGGKEHGLYVSSTPSSAAKKAVTKLCAANKSKNVEFSIREITQGSKKKTYGPYTGYIEKLKDPIELKGRVIRYKPVAKLSGKSGAKKGGMFINPVAGSARENNNNPSEDSAPVNNLNINDFSKNEQVAYIFLKIPEHELTYDYDEIIKQLNQIDNDIFDIDINDSSRCNGYGGREPFTTISIKIKDFSKAKNKPNFESHLQILIKILKYFKKAAVSGFYNTKFNLIKPNDSFSPDYNDFLKMLP
jgi:hypothetical protein